MNTVSTVITTLAFPAERRLRVTSVAFACTVMLLAWPAVTSAQGLEDPIPRTIDVAGPPFELTVVAQGMTAPNWGTSSPVHPGRLVVTDQAGIVWSVDLDSGDTTVLADLSDLIVGLGIAGPGTFDERGLLGFAFHPDFATNGLVYTYTSQPVDGPADFSTLAEGEIPNHQSVITEWQVPDPLDPAAVVDPTTAREILRIDEPQFNHDAGTLAFGPDAMLYVSLGDGGGADDQGAGHVPGGNGQEPGNVLGTILRIDPLGSDAANGRYGIPDDNPFVGTEGALDEVFAFGFRNPFRFSFDILTGEMYCADVGQNDIEEVDLVVAGGNYGWPVKEGSFLFDQNGDGNGFVYGTRGAGPEDLIDPIAEYDHDEGIAIIGGFVYRGRDIPALRGWYVFGDYAGDTGSQGRLFAMMKNPADHTTPIHELPLQGEFDHFVLGFGQDEDGEVYVLVNDTGNPFGDTGAVLKLEPAFGRPDGSGPPDHAEAFAERVRGRATPNPFNPATRIEYRMPRDGRLRITVHDVRGAVVRVLLDETVAAGAGTVRWEGRDDRGRSVGSGVYYWQMRALGQRTTGRLTMVK